MINPSDPDALRGLRLLVVEDAFLVADMVAAILEDAGVEVVGPVGKVEPAVVLARQEALDGALLDVDLGGAHSGPIAEALRARGIPFIFLTGYCTATALPAPFRDASCVSKPFDARDLKQQVASSFSRSRAAVDPRAAAQTVPSTSA